MRNGKQYLLGLLGAIATIYAFAVPDAKGFQKPALARIFFWHFPSTLAATVMLFIGLYFSIQVLRRKDPLADARAAAANELGVLFGLLVLTTGMLFSYVQWGAFWSWDPRQSSFLLVMLIYAGYFVLRASLTDPNTRAMNSAVYWCYATPAQLFLLFVFPRLPQIDKQSLHPSKTITSGLLSGDYAIEVCIAGALFIAFAVQLYQHRIKVQALLDRADALDEKEQAAVRAGQTYVEYPRTGTVSTSTD